ncbi:disulfide oxidoreductase [Paenibacillus lemnae]|uniref:Disulfide bond formation protein B n=1 Tax=Paenibacillus lemnae TaxID=1330551 RepID=A0A848M3I7_PAELE|nr:disulfide oxidoreductase [Paenibacillus lemnae]NMO94403.1 disulfide bond formation protein B [Paenibacillus lemnae]
MKRKVAWLYVAWTAAVIATGASLFLSEIWHFTPCELCWYQRIFMYPLVIILGIAAHRRKTHIVPYIMPLPLVGASISIYHIIIQKIPHDTGIAACGAVSCADDYLNWFGWLTIPMLALTAFLMIALSLWLARR